MGEVGDRSGKMNTDVESGVNTITIAGIEP